jgi:hypothetical protein
VDTELVYAYARNKDLGPLEEFITGSHLANLQSVGDRCAPPPPAPDRPQALPAAAAPSTSPRLAAAQLGQHLPGATWLRR